MSLQIRHFRRNDRDQLTALVNSHVEAVIPGGSIPVNGVLTQLEREPGEYIVDPWVSERITLVAEQRNGIAAAALLLRYRTDADVPTRYRSTGEIRWLVFTPVAPTDNANWPDGNAAAAALIAKCDEHFRNWNTTLVYADGALPAPGIYGVPEQWPHVAALYRMSDRRSNHHRRRIRCTRHCARIGRGCSLKIHLRSGRHGNCRHCRNGDTRQITPFHHSTPSFGPTPANDLHSPESLI